MSRAKPRRDWPGSDSFTPYRLPDTCREQILHDLNIEDPIESEKPQKLFQEIEREFKFYEKTWEQKDQKPAPQSRLKEIAPLSKLCHETHEELSQLSPLAIGDISVAIIDRHPDDESWANEKIPTQHKIIRFMERMKKDLSTLTKLTVQAQKNLKQKSQKGPKPKLAFPLLCYHLDNIFNRYYQKVPLTKTEDKKKFFDTTLQALHDAKLTDEQIIWDGETIQKHVFKYRRLNR